MLFRSLTRDHSPVEMRTWVAAFKAYFVSSCMDKCSRLEQHAYVKSCLGPFLIVRLQNKIMGDTPIFGENSYMSAIENEFLLRHPIFTRRLGFFRSAQSTNQPFSDWAGQLRRVGDEAQLCQLGTDELYVMRYIVGTSDPKLRARFLEECEPTLAKLDAVVAEYEVARTSLKAMGGGNTGPNGVGVNMVNTSKTGGARTKRTNNSNPTNRTGGSSGAPTCLNDLRDQKRCFRCGKDRSHGGNKCTAGGKTCSKCGRVGHLASVCFGTQGKHTATVRTIAVPAPKAEKGSTKLPKEKSTPSPAPHADAGSTAGSTGETSKRKSKGCAKTLLCSTD